MTITENDNGNGTAENNGKCENGADMDQTITIDVKTQLPILYKTGDTPPIYLTLFFAVQVHARWVPRLLKSHEKERRVRESRAFLARHKKEGDAFLSRIITTDETWLWFYDPETKSQSAVWKHSDSPPPKKARVSKCGGKYMFIMFADMEGMILNHAVPSNTTVNADYYSKQSLLSIAGSIVLPLLVADAVCAQDSGHVIRKLVSSTFFMSGLTTLLQVTVGVRLPLFQGPTSSYIIPVIALSKMDPTRCDVAAFHGLNSTLLQNSTITELTEQLVDYRIRELMWPLMIAGLLHCLVGLTGMVGILLRYIGPITIVPTILLIGLYIVKPATRFIQSHWGITALTWFIGCLLSLYLSRFPMPIPVWTRRKGFHIVRYPLHMVFALLISILIGWSVCGIMTYAGAFPDDPSDIMYKARTDARADVVRETGWFYMPYPGQFGAPLFSISAIVGFVLATILSILDSIGDYYAAAAMCRVPTPPPHAVNRGIAVEGFCSALSGLYGIGHATSTYGGNIGAIGMTKVASRQVFIFVGIIYMLLGVIAKCAAAFVSIPYPVLGGVMLLSVGVFMGVNLSNLKSTSLTSTRNLSIMGMAIFIGVLVPSWMEKNSRAIKTGNGVLDQVLIMLLGNPNFFGTTIAFVMDNTVPGTLEERGIAAWQKPEDANENTSGGNIEGVEVYELPVPAKVKQWSFWKYVPVCPHQPEMTSEDYEMDEVFHTNINL